MPSVGTVTMGLMSARGLVTGGRKLRHAGSASKTASEGTTRLSDSKH